MKRIRIVTFAAVMALVLFVAAPSSATPEFSARSGQSCSTCHMEGSGGQLTGAGLQYAASGYKWPPAGGYRVLGPIRKSVRLVIGLLHVLGAFMWFGTILYVHIMLKPAYAEKGLPRGEVALGMVSMMVVGLSGVLLTVSRVKGLDVLYTSPWGIVLLVKIVIYSVMVSSAAFAVFYIGPRLRKPAISVAMPPNGVFDPVTLSAFDGSGGGRAFIAYGGVVYDVTELRLWKNGTHMKHKAGADLTAFIPKAPHGVEKLSPLKQAGTFDDTLTPPKSPAQKAFYVVAYMNLALVFAELVTISYWRWGL